MSTTNFLPLWVVACATITFFTEEVVANDRTVAVSVHVSTKGVDTSQPAGALKIYGSLKNAALLACTRGNRAGLAPEDNPLRCVEKSLAAAVRSANLPTVTRIYLSTHTLQQAEASGITVPVLAAAGPPPQ